MPHRDEALEAFRTEEQQRLYEWRNTPKIADLIGEAAFGVVDDYWHSMATRPELVPPYEADLSVDVPGHREAVVASFRDDDLQLYVRVDLSAGPEHPSVVVHPVGVCGRCDAKVPLEPAAATVQELGATLVAGVPSASHRCRGA